ncbi:MAG: hypothetical protein H6673_11840 [Anaerolineales bacterium]|nr:hypothetical protein [Anaerolineales bacterium]
MKTSTTKPQYGWSLVVIGSIIPITLVLGHVFNLSHRFTIPIIVLALLLAGAMALWIHANVGATGDEWWQDESSLGWRGY